MRIPRTFVRSAAVLTLGSQVLIQGLAPSVWAAPVPVRGLTATRLSTEAARTPESRALAARRLERWRSFPHRIGVPSGRPFVTGRRPPLLAMKAGRLERTSFFTGAPETLRVLG